jgi:hypothetical protein
LDEVEKRNITTTNFNQRFLNWLDDENFQLDAEGVRYDSLVFRAYRTAKKLKVGSRYIEENDVIEVSNWRRQTTPDETEENDDNEQVPTNRFLNK